MTEKPKSATESYFDTGPVAPVPATSMLLMKAGRLADFDGRDGWPEAFTIGELAALQYPEDKALQDDLIAILTPPAHRGDVETVTLMREPEAWVWALDDPRPIPKFPEAGLMRDASAPGWGRYGKRKPQKSTLARRHPPQLMRYQASPQVKLSKVSGSR